MPFYLIEQEVAVLGLDNNKEEKDKKLHNNIRKKIDQFARNPDSIMLMIDGPILGVICENKELTDFFF